MIRADKQPTSADIRMAHSQARVLEPAGNASAGAGFLEALLDREEAFLQRGVGPGDLPVGKPLARAYGVPESDFPRR